MEIKKQEVNRTLYLATIIFCSYNSFLYCTSWNLSENGHYCNKWERANPNTQQNMCRILQWTTGESKKQMKLKIFGIDKLE